MDQTIRVYFMINADLDEPSAETSSAYSYIKDHLPERNIQWITESEGFELTVTESLTKQDVFVLEKFEGPVFDRLKDTKCLVLGPRCLTTCILECSPIPLGNSPVFSTSMRGLHISASGLGAEEKEKVRRLVSWMGGYYFQNLGRSITHLVSNTIKSTKYEHAALNNIAIMHTDWVYTIWERSCKETICATDEEFEKFKLPVFYGVNITCSGLDSDKKNEVMRLVNENGGIFNRAFRSQITDIVIIEKHSANSDKYKAAVSYKKDILIPEWIFDSVSKGYALPTKLYEVRNIKASTPTKPDHTISDFQNGDYTQLSDISRISSTADHKRVDSTVNESVCSVAIPTLRSSNGRSVISDICPIEAKKAGPFLDGCCIYLCGFKADDKEKLNKILNTSAATRYDEMNDNITHIIVGPSGETDLKTLKKLGLLTGVYVVKLDWLLESIKLRQPTSEALYRIEVPSEQNPDAPSPSSKKTLKSMNHSFKQPDVPRKRLNFNSKPVEGPSTPDFPSTNNFEESDILAQYSQDNSSVHRNIPELPPKLASNSDSDLTIRKPVLPPVAPELESEFTNALSTLDYDNLDFLSGMSIYIDKGQFVDEFYSQMIYECESARGNIVHENYKDVVDYAIVSFEKTVDPSEFPVTARQVVNELWMEDSIKENCQVPIKYYHRHIPKYADKKPLKGMILVVSIYTGLERDFIDSLAELLGATLNKAFVKRETPLLICPNAEGSKYEGAIKWRFPVVNSDWLIECAREGRKLDFAAYLVGDSEHDFPGVVVKVGSTPLATTPLIEKNQLHRSDADLGTVPDFTPLRNKRVSQLAGPSKRKSTDAPESPHTPIRNAVVDTYDYLDEFAAAIENDAERECMRECIEEMKNNQTPELERIKRYACTPVNKRVATPKGIPDFCKTPAFRQRMLEELDRRWHLSIEKRKPDTPLNLVCKRVLRATFEKYGIAIDNDAGTPTSHKSSSSLNFDNISKSSSTEMEVDETSSPSVKQLSDFIKNCEGRRQSLHARQRNEEETAASLQKFDSEAFGGTEPMVGWRDPSEFTISRRSKPNGMQFQGTPKFTISCLEESTKADLIEKIRQLNGNVCENLNNFDISCTHLLCEKPNRGEKFLGCISSGKYILSIEYIDECCKHDFFVDEELFEWGNPKSNKSSESLPAEEKIIANAAYRWRRKMQGNSDGLIAERTGAFDDFTVILNVSEKNKDSLKNVIRAGGGNVIDVHPPYAKSGEALKATHCFVDVKKAPLKRSDHEALVEHGVRVLSQMYINAYLMNGSEVDPVKYDLR